MLFITDEYAFMGFLAATAFWHSFTMCTDGFATI
jgi:hypothetical protein